MSRRLRRGAAAAVIAACLLVPQVSWAQGGSPWNLDGGASRPAVEPWSGLSEIWSVLVKLVSGDRSKNRGQIDPDGREQTSETPSPPPPVPVGSGSSGDNRGGIDPDG